ncbi:hypothetical protein MMU07_20440 [Aquiflexum sp. LQ15W]|uniref:hypothetical protein n=1 Tax=Cognataquiflexum nitidum TaxID=2922272 RepID=UPI001F1404F5|nr:hypothetical protein [Cognataquiflexum nitidum]MCH6201958.1 hypothetical protein [Cognataquiflexum nitidum]
MKSKKILSTLFYLIFLFHVVPIFTFSCIDNCSGQALLLRYQELAGMPLEYVPSNPGWQANAWSNDKNLTSDKLLLFFDLTYEPIAEVRPSNSTMGFPFALACDPAVNFESTIKTWDLVSNKDFNNDFPAGTSLNEIALIAPIVGREFLSFTDYQDSQMGYRGLGTSFVRFSGLSTQSSPMSFTCTITLTDGRIFSSQVDNIVLRVE